MVRVHLFMPITGCDLGDRPFFTLDDEEDDVTHSSFHIWRALTSQAMQPFTHTPLTLHIGGQAI